jgi:hypothetical protein
MEQSEMEEATLEEINCREEVREMAEMKHNRRSK